VNPNGFGPRSPAAAFLVVTEARRGYVRTETKRVGTVTTPGVGITSTRRRTGNSAETRRAVRRDWCRRFSSEQTTNVRWRNKRTDVKRKYLSPPRTKTTDWDGRFFRSALGFSGTGHIQRDRRETISATIPTLFERKLRWPYKRKCCFVRSIRISVYAF